MLKIELLRPILTMSRPTLPKCLKFHFGGPFWYQAAEILKIELLRPSLTMFGPRLSRPILGCHRPEEHKNKLSDGIGGPLWHQKPKYLQIDFHRPAESVNKN